MEKRKEKHILGFLFFIALIALSWFLGNYCCIDIENIQRSLASVPWFYSSLAYIILYVVVTFFIWFSKDVFWFAGAVLFGALFSALLIWTAEIINAFILFFFSRRLGRNFVEQYLKGKYSTIDEKVGKLNFLWLFLFRAAPLIPYRFLDLGAGLTRISFRTYLAAVVLGSPFKIFWIQYLLTGVGRSIFSNPYVVAEYFMSNKTLFFLSMLYLVSVIAVIAKLKFNRNKKICH